MTSALKAVPETTNSLVSICIPTFQMATFLPQAIESALAQSFRSIEVVVCDNASTDGTAALQRSFSQACVRWLRFEEHVSMYGNYNRCLRLARGRFIKFLAADDYLPPDYVRETVRLLSESLNVGMVTTPGVTINGSREVERTDASYRRTIMNRDAVLRQLGREGLPKAVSPSHSIFRREVFEAVGVFDEGLVYADLDHLLATLERFDLGWTSLTNVFIREHPAAAHVMLGRTTRFLEELFVIVRRRLLHRDARPLERIAGHRLLLQTAERAAWSMLKAALQRDTNRARQILSILRSNGYLAPVVLYGLLDAPIFLVRKVRRVQ